MVHRQLWFDLPIGAAEVRHLRDMMGTTMSAAARHVGVSESTWRRWEAGTVLPRGMHKQELARLIAAYERAQTE